MGLLGIQTENVCLEVVHVAVFSVGVPCEAAGTLVWVAVGNAGYTGSAGAWHGAGENWLLSWLGGGDFVFSWLVRLCVKDRKMK